MASTARTAAGDGELAMLNKKLGMLLLVIRCYKLFDMEMAILWRLYRDRPGVRRASSSLANAYGARREG